ncbi:MAG TPA: hypothetical protein VFL94_07255 [Actinomycetales bacterium]|nr:hypothetical protein [Actinomycetales bacterium]
MNRPEAVAVVALLVLLAWGLMYLGWKHRQARQADVATPEPVTEALSERARAHGVEGSYVSTTSAGEPLERITAHGLGIGGVAHVLVVDSPAGVVIDRTGAPGLLVPATALADVRVESMRAGKAAPHGLLVVEWRLGDRAVATAFRPRDPKDREPLMRSVRALIARQDAA